MLVTLILITGCTQNIEFWKIEKFDILENGLKENEEVTAIYYSGGPHDEYVEGGYYRHAVVISSITQDTFNVLTFPTYDLENISSGNNIFNFISNPAVEKLIPNLEDFPEDMQESLLNSEPEKTEWAKYSKVIRNPDFDYITNNEHKTVIGALTKE